MSRSIVSRLLLILGILAASLSAFAQTLEFTIGTPDVRFRQGKKGELVASVKNTGTSRVYLNQVSIQIPGASGVDFDPNGFFVNFEGALEPGAVKAAPLVTFEAEAEAPTASYRAVIAILGGADEEAAENLGQREASVTVEPEPAPDTGIVEGIGEGFVSCATSQTFSFTGSDNETPVGELRFVWRLDQGVWSTPSSERTVTLNNLGQGPHRFEVAAVDGLGKIDASAATRNFVVDLRALEITTPTVGDLSALSARISWQSNRPGTSSVEYRVLGEDAWQKLVVANRSSAHVGVIEDLKPVTTYQARVMTIDDCGNEAVSEVFEFRTLRTKVLIATPDTNEIRLKPGVPFEQDLELRNIADVSLTGIRALIENLPANVTLEISSPETLVSGAIVPVRYRLLAQNETILAGLPRIRFASNEGDEALVGFNLKIVPRRPRIEVQPSALTGAMLRGVPKVVEAILTNTGDVAATNVRVTVPVASWLNLATESVIASLAPGDSVAVTLNLTPAIDLTLGSYRGSIALAGDNVSVSLPFDFECASTGKGRLRILVTDEATYFTDSALKVAGARVVIRKVDTDVVVAEGISDGLGLFLTDELPEGRYNIEVSEEKHGGYRGTTEVVAGREIEQEAFLPMQRLSYRWSVLPSPIDDEYVVDLDAVFETSVPAPVVTVFPTLIHVKDLKFDAEGKAVVNYTVTNHGLIAVNNGKFFGHDLASYSVTPLLADVGTLAPKTAVVIPVVIQRKDALQANLDGGQGQGGIEMADCYLHMRYETDYPCGPFGVKIKVEVYLRIVQCLSFPSFPTGPGGGGDNGDTGSSRPGPIIPPAPVVEVKDCICIDDPSKCYEAPGWLVEIIDFAIHQLVRRATPGAALVANVISPFLDFNVNLTGIRICLDVICVDGEPTVRVVGNYGDGGSGPGTASGGAGGTSFTPKDVMRDPSRRVKFQVPNHEDYDLPFDDIDASFAAFKEARGVEFVLGGTYTKIGRQPATSTLTVRSDNRFAVEYLEQLITQTVTYENGDKLVVTIRLSDPQGDAVLDFLASAFRGDGYTIVGFFSMAVRSSMTVEATLNGVPIPVGDQGLFFRDYYINFGN